MPRLTLKTTAALAMLVLVSACKTELYTGLSEQEANEIIAVLHRNQIGADRTLGSAGSVTVNVDKTRFADAVELLREQGYPKHDFATLGDVFQGDGFVVSPMEEKARFVFAMTEELSRTVSDIDGVLSARTHVVLPTSDKFSQDKTPSSASVFIRHDASFDLASLVPQIKLLVANSIEGLSYEKVSVVLVPVIRAPEPVPLPAGQPVSVAQAGILGAVASALAAALGLCGWVLLRRRFSPSTGFKPTPAE